MWRRRSRAPAAALALLLTPACNVGPDHEPPERDTAADWGVPAAEELGGTRAVDLEAWWRSFTDPRLTELVELAQQRNLDLLAAVSRVREARYLHGAATGEMGPDLAAIGSFTRSRRSSNSILGFFAGDRSLWSIGFDAAWEIDVFGRLQRGREAAGADFEVAIEDARDVQVSLNAEVARNYAELRGLQRRLRIARQNESAQQRTLELTRARFTAGLTAELDVAQARANLATTRSTIPPLEAERTAAESRLAVLLGVEPARLDELAPWLLDDDAPEAAAVPDAPRSITIGVPADLLRRRPDVRRAEREVAAASARIGVAEAELYPSLSLTGTIGLASQESNDLIKASSRDFAFGPAFRWNLFQTGRLRALVHAAEERHLQALITWEQAVLTALEESRNAIDAFVQEQRRRAELREGVAAAEQSVELSQSLYVQGVSDFQRVLDAQRSLFELQDQLATSDVAVTTELIALYKALGGGWTPPPPEAAATAETAADD